MRKFFVAWLNMKLRGEIYKHNTYIYLSMRYRNYQSCRNLKPVTWIFGVLHVSPMSTKSLALTCAWLVLARQWNFARSHSLNPFVSFWLAVEKNRKTWENLCVFSLFWWDLYPIEAKWVPSSSQQTWPKLKDMLPMFLEPILLAQLGAAWGPWTASSVSRWVRSPKGLELRGLAFKMWGGKRPVKGMQKG